MYTADFAEIYEFVYSDRGKSWPEESGRLHELIRARRPDADSLLDVACGTGAHLETFAGLFSHVEGVEIAEGMRDVARRRRPDIPVHAGDMRDFHLGREYSAVTCLYNSIAYLESVDEMREAIRCMVRHTAPGGVVIIEPWWFPERFLEGHLTVSSHGDGERAVARMSHSTREGRRTRLEVHFLVGGGEGIREFTMTHLLMMFTKDEYLHAFAEAGCPAEYVEGGLTGRGLFIGERSA